MASEASQSSTLPPSIYNTLNTIVNEYSENDNLNELTLRVVLNEIQSRCSEDVFAAVDTVRGKQELLPIVLELIKAKINNASKDSEEDTENAKKKENKSTKTETASEKEVKSKNESASEDEKKFKTETASKKDKKEKTETSEKKKKKTAEKVTKERSKKSSSPQKRKRHSSAIDEDDSSTKKLKKELKMSRDDVEMQQYLLDSIALGFDQRRTRRSTQNSTAASVKMHKKRKESEKKAKEKKKASDSEETPKKKRTTAWNKPKILSNALAQFIGQNIMPRNEVSAKLIKYIKDNNLKDPKDGRKIVFDEKLSTVFKCKGTTWFKLNTLLTKHLFDDTEL